MADENNIAERIAKLEEAIEAIHLELADIRSAIEEIRNEIDELRSIIGGGGESLWRGWP